MLQQDAEGAMRMVVNEEQRQLEIAEQLEANARTLAQSSRTVPHPADSYQLLGELTATLEHLQQVTGQLAQWHRQVVDGREYAGEDERGDGATGTLQAAAQLDAAAALLEDAARALGAAHEANGVVRWRDQ